MVTRTKLPRKKSKRQRKSPEELRRLRLQRRFKSDIRTAFVNSGFTHVATRDKEFTFEGRTGEIDGIFAYENIIVVVEETTHAPDHIGDHLRKKAELFDHLEQHSESLVQFLGEQFKPLESYFKGNPHLDPRQCLVKYLYCSRYDIEETTRVRHRRSCIFLPYASLQYFLRLSRTIRKSARFELLKFLNVGLADIAGPSRAELHRYKALQLPEVPSGFPEGHKLVSFLIDPYTLIERAYVLRADSWRDESALYQRLLVKGKISNMRDYLTSERRVFVNNVIVTLPSTTKFTSTDRAGRRQDEITAGDLVIPREFNTIGIIDGQHRVFAYHEGDDRHERTISVLRTRQHLLVTGIIYPEGMSTSHAHEFEARLFLEINDKQKRVRGDLKQSIERIVNPYSTTAIAKSVLERMASTGPLAGMLEVHFFDVGKIKTASIVSYGMRHIVGLEAKPSLFRAWKGAGKASVRAKSNKAGLTNYINFAAQQLNLLVAGFKARVGTQMWTTDRKVSRALSATTVNGLIFCMRRLLEEGKVLGTFDEYRDAFALLNMDFSPSRFAYASSHWRDLGEELYRQCFT